jgi:ribonuclease BN (tRNA processing enzyme)
MRATFLGTADGHTSASRHHSGIFLRWAEHSLLLDCGAPAAQYLRHHQCEPDQPDLVWLSHMHSDHVGSFPGLIQSLWLRARRAPLHVYAPQPVILTLQDYLEKCLLFPELIGFPIEWHPVTGKKKFTHGALTLTSFPTQHLQSLAKFFQKGYPETCFDCYGLIIESGEDRVVYSADIATPRDLRPHLKKPVRALLCELTHFPEHMLFEELAQTDTIKKVFLTHYPDHLAKKETELKKLATASQFNGKIRLVSDGETAVL